MSKFNWRDIAARLLVTGALIIAGCVFYFALTGYSFLAYSFFAAALIAAAYLALRLAEGKWPKTVRVTRRIMSFGLAVFAVALLITEGAILFGGRETGDDRADYMIVMGAGLRGTVPSLSLWTRLEAALDYLNKYPDATCVVSGGQGPGESITEAEAMASWLKQRGVDPERIIGEDRATSTVENIRFSHALIKAHAGRDVEKIAIVTNGFHILRSKLVAEHMGLTPLGVPAGLGLPFLTVSSYLREALALWNYLVFG